MRYKLNKKHIDVGDIIRGVDGNNTTIRVLSKTTIPATPGYFNTEVPAFNVEIKFSKSDIVKGIISEIDLLRDKNRLRNVESTHYIDALDWTSDISDSYIELLIDEYHLYPTDDIDITGETVCIMRMISAECRKHQIIQLNVNQGYHRIFSIFKRRIPKIHLLGLDAIYNQDLTEED